MLNKHYYYIKSLIAYSSVSHMSMVLAGILIMNYWGMFGSFMMIARELYSSGMFCLANIMYERVQSRSILMSKDMLNLMPSMSFWLFLLCSSNMAAPPSFNSLGEISLLSSVISYSWILILEQYMLYIYILMVNMDYSGKFSCSLGFIREYLLLFDLSLNLSNL